MISRLRVGQASRKHTLKRPKFQEIFATPGALNEMDVHTEFICDAEPALCIFDNGALYRVAFHVLEIPSLNEAGRSG